MTHFMLYMYKCALKSIRHKIYTMEIVSNGNLPFITMTATKLTQIM